MFFTFELARIQVADQIQLIALQVSREIRVLQILQRGTTLFITLKQCGVKAGDAVGSDLCSLVNRWQECAAVVASAAIVGWWAKRDKAWQVLVFTAEPIQRPSAHRRPHKLEAACVHLDKGL